jgi:beta-lactamase class D
MESVVWYSQELTRSLGMPRFRAYVDSFGYGNRDLTGDGKGNGLVQAWLSSSLKVTPRQQLEFLTKVRGHRLGFATRAYALLDSVMPRTPGPEGWTVAGKTGSGAPKDSAGKTIPGRSVGWYVGWLERGGKAPLLFVHRELDLAPPGSFGGPSARQSFLAELPRRLQALESRAKP